MRESFKKWTTVFVLLNRRFLRKPLLIFLLCLIPLIALLMRHLPAGDESLIRVGIAADNKEDALASSVIRRLVSVENSSAVRFVRYETGSRLHAAVQKEEVLLGFLLPDDLSALFEAYATVPKDSGGVLSAFTGALSIASGTSSDPEQKKAMADNAIRVICPSNDIVTKLEKEQFFGKLYSDIELSVLKCWLDARADDLSMTKEERDRFIDEAMAGYSVDVPFFRMTFQNGDTVLEGEASNYFLSPLKGMLAITLILVCFAAALFLMQDSARGLFVWVRPARLPFFHYLYLLIPTLDAGLFACIALALSGALQSGNELPAFLLDLLCTVGFTNLLRVCLRRMPVFSATIPIVIMACLFLTPVFFDIRLVPALQACLPPY